MDFVKVEKLNTHMVVLILFILKNKAILVLKKNLKNFGLGKYSKREQHTNFTTI